MGGYTSILVIFGLMIVWVIWAVVNISPDKDEGPDEA